MIMTFVGLAARRQSMKKRNAKLATAFPNGARCQKCLEMGHWSYECKEKRKYVHRSSRTKQLDKHIAGKILEESAKNDAKAIKAKRSKMQTVSESSSSESDSDSDSSSSSSSSNDDISSCDSSSHSKSTDSVDSSESSQSSDASSAEDNSVEDNDEPKYKNPCQSPSNASSSSSSSTQEEE